MKTATEIWFDNLKDIWLRKAANEIEGIVSENFTYFEDPFETPITKSTDLIDVWKEIENQDIELLEITSIISGNNTGLARYHFIADILGIRHESKGAYFVRLDEDGKATEFRQWWNAK